MNLYLGTQLPSSATPFSLLPSSMVSASPSITMSASQRRAADVQFLDHMIDQSPSQAQSGRYHSQQPSHPSHWDSQPNSSSQQPRPTSTSQSSQSFLDQAIAEKEERIARARELKEQFMRRKNELAQSEQHIREITAPSRAVQTNMAVVNGALHVLPTTSASVQTAATKAVQKPESHKSTKCATIRPHVATVAHERQETEESSHAPSGVSSLTARKGQPTIQEHLITIQCTPVVDHDLSLEAQPSRTDGSRQSLLDRFAYQPLEAGQASISHDDEENGWSLGFVMPCICFLICSQKAFIRCQSKSPHRTSHRK